MGECVLFDKNGREIDWYDPIEETDVIETEKELTINHSNGMTYKISRNYYSHYTIREVKHEK